MKGNIETFKILRNNRLDMPRLLRVNASNMYYHIFNRANARKSICLTDFTYSYFIYLLGELVDQFDFEIYSFCLMKNHYHILLKTKKPNLSKGMYFFCKRFALYINKLLNTDGPVFKDRYSAILIRNEHYLLNVSRYIHLNPVEANIVKQFQDYQWSSGRGYITDTHGYSFLNTTLITDYFLRTEEYCEFVGSGVDKKTRLFYKKRNYHSVFVI